MPRDEICRLLADHAPADDRELRFVRDMGRLLESGSDPTSRDHYEPGHFTASAFVLSPDGRDVLLIEHGKLHRWLQPGGHIEPGDASVEAACRREVAEETGLTDLALRSAGLFDVDVHQIPALRGQPSHQHHDLRMCFVAGTRAIVAGSDAKAVRWEPWAAIDPAITDESVMRALRKLARG